MSLDTATTALDSKYAGAIKRFVFNAVRSHGTTTIDQLLEVTDLPEDTLLTTLAELTYEGAIDTVEKRSRLSKKVRVEYRFPPLRNRRVAFEPAEAPEVIDLTKSS